MNIIGTIRQGQDISRGPLRDSPRRMIQLVMGERVGLVTTITDCAMTIEEGSILANSLNGETDLEQ